MKKLITALTIVGSLASAGTVGQEKGRVFVYEPDSKNVRFLYNEETTDTSFVPKSSKKPYFSAGQSSDVKFSAEPSDKVFKGKPKNSVRFYSDKAEGLDGTSID